MKNKIISLISAAAIIISCVPTAVFSASEEVNPDTSDWFVYEYPKADDIEGTILDSSDALDVPAGKHGFLSGYDGDTFIFEDGTEAHFWGAVMSSGISCYPEREMAIESAKRIAQSGFNAVRLDGLALGAKGVGGRTLRTDRMDKLCFFINELKSRGIYVMLNIMAGISENSDMSDVYDIENLGSELKVYSNFNEDLQQEVFDYMDLLLNYENKYTGLRLKDDPAIAMMCIRNEDSFGALTNLSSKKYSKEITAKYNEWLRQKYGTTENLEAAWRNDGDESKEINGLKDGESLEDGTVILYDNDMVRRNGRVIDEYKFKSEVMADSYRKEREHMREIGAKCMITSSTSWAGNGIETISFHVNRDSDYTDTHIYTGNWAGHQYTDGMTRTESVGSVLEPVNGEVRSNLVTDSSIRMVFGHPYVISEWNDNPPNRYRSETLLMMGSYSALNGMNPFIYCWRPPGTYDTKASTETIRKEVFGAATTPEYMAAFPAIGRIFQRGDVTETDQRYLYKRYRGDEKYSNYDQFINGKEMYGRYLGFIGKTGMVFEERYDESAYDNTVLQLAADAYNGDKNFVSATGELSMDFTNKMFRMNTKKAQAISGFTAGKTVELDDVKFSLDNYYATAYLNSIDDAPLNESKKMLLTVVGDTRNTGQVMSDDEKTLISGGTAPVLAEPITGTVTIKTDSRIRVKAIDLSGHEKSDYIALTKMDGGYSFELKSDYKTMYYQITRTKAGTENAHISLGNTKAHNVFTDVSASDPQKKAIERVALSGYMKAASGTRFAPDMYVSKKDFVDAAVRATRIIGRVWYDPDASVFADLANTDPAYETMDKARYLHAVSYDIINGKTYIYPDNNVTRGEAMVWLAKLLGDGEYPYFGTRRVSGSFSLSQYSDAYSAGKNAEYYRKILGLGYMDAKDGKIAANDLLTRRETAEIMYRLAWNG